MSSIHIISVGASIITNYSREKDKIEIPPVDEDLKFENILTDKTKFNKILEFVKKDAYRASAELNALKEFIETKNIDEVHLIITDTFVGKVTSEIIKKILKEKNIKTSNKIIPGYYKEKAKDEIEAERKFIEGLSNLRDSLLHYIRNKKANNPKIEILINATAGFKPEMLILMLVGSLTNTKVYYIHEFFKRILYLPPLFLPLLNKKISDALTEIYNLPNKRVAGEKFCDEYKTKYEDIYDELTSFKLILEKIGERDNKLIEIKITDYGRLLADIKN